jgi:hypothetical protein
MPAIQLEAVSASLFTWFADQFPLEVPLAFPGLRLDTSDLSEWLELSIAAWTARPQRSTALRQLTLSLTIHLFVKQQLDQSRILELADTVRQTLAQQTVPLRDYETSGSPIVGYATLFEPDTQNLTRPEANTHAMHHFAITTPLTAHQI